MGLCCNIINKISNNSKEDWNNDKSACTNARKYRKKQNLVIDIIENKIYENFNKINKNLNKKEIKEIVEVLQKHFVFFSLANDELYNN